MPSLRFQNDTVAQTTIPIHIPGLCSAGTAHANAQQSASLAARKKHAEESQYKEEILQLQYGALLHVDEIDLISKRVSKSTAVRAVIECMDRYLFSKEILFVHKDRELRHRIRDRLVESWTRASRSILKSWLLYGFAVVRISPDATLVGAPCCLDVATLRIRVKFDEYHRATYTVFHQPPLTETQIRQLVKQRTSLLHARRANAHARTRRARARAAPGAPAKSNVSVDASGTNAVSGAFQSAFMAPLQAKDDPRSAFGRETGFSGHCEEQEISPQDCTDPQLRPWVILDSVVVLAVSDPEQGGSLNSLVSVLMEPYRRVWEMEQLFARASETRAQPLLMVTPTVDHQGEALALRRQAASSQGGRPRKSVGGARAGAPGTGGALASSLHGAAMAGIAGPSALSLDAVQLGAQGERLVSEALAASGAGGVAEGHLYSASMGLPPGAAPETVSRFVGSRDQMHKSHVQMEQYDQAASSMLLASMSAAASRARWGPRPHGGRPPPDSVYDTASYDEILRPVASRHRMYLPSHMHEILSSNFAPVSEPREAKVPDLAAVYERFAKSVAEVFQMPRSIWSSQDSRYKLDHELELQRLHETLATWGKRLETALNELSLSIYGEFVMRTDLEFVQRYLQEGAGKNSLPNVVVERQHHLTQGTVRDSDLAITQDTVDALAFETGLQLGLLHCLPRAFLVRFKDSYEKHQAAVSKRMLAHEHGSALEDDPVSRSKTSEKGKDDTSNKGQEDVNNQLLNLPKSADADPGATGARTGKNTVPEKSTNAGEGVRSPSRLRAAKTRKNAGSPSSEYRHDAPHSRDTGDDQGGLVAHLRRQGVCAPLLAKVEEQLDNLRRERRAQMYIQLHLGGWSSGKATGGTVDHDPHKWAVRFDSSNYGENPRLKAIGVRLGWMMFSRTTQTTLIAQQEQDALQLESQTMQAKLQITRLHEERRELNAAIRRGESIFTVDTRFHDPLQTGTTTPSSRVNDTDEGESSEDSDGLSGDTSTHSSDDTQSEGELSKSRRRGKALRGKGGKRGGGSRGLPRETLREAGVDLERVQKQRKFAKTKKRRELRDRASKAVPPGRTQAQEDRDRKEARKRRHDEYERGADEIRGPNGTQRTYKRGRYNKTLQGVERAGI